ncbi:hypothetical protein FJT64_009078 [Amphibalanus amphitrite]|uniref:Uncharacterized protein n=1 Tax=Amphibalanus amphitrite TaxID=1232801 RepID=A0A6A4VQJ2_AMPAM|nr:hypothetical protein FJT64_009078 [Amphibalanus amphitrite]
MRVGGDQKKSSSSFVFRELTVEHAENGSLAFGDGGDFSMTELNITPPEQLVCRLKHWFRALIGKEESSSLTEMEELVVRQLNEKGYCPTPKLARITTTTTTGAAETTTERAGVRASPPDRSDAGSEVIAGHPRPEPADTAAQLDVSRLTLFLVVGIAAVLAVSAGLAVWLLVCSKKGGDPRNRRI